MNIDCCKSYVGKQIIGLLPSEQECLYYLVVNSQDLGVSDFTGWKIDGVDVYASGYYWYPNYVNCESIIISYIGTQPTEVIFEDPFGFTYSFVVEKVTKYGGACEKVCYQAEFDYGSILYYIDFYQLGGATTLLVGIGINIDDEAGIQGVLTNLLGPDVQVSSVWNGSKYVVTINNAYNLGGLMFNFSLADETTFNVLPCEITPPTPVPLEFLTAYPGAGAAYSVRKLSSSYGGAAVRVRRSSDNTEQDIGFVGFDLDTTALTSFVGAGSGFITRWYDQSGNGRNMTQTTAGLQPTIVSSGTIITRNGNVSIYFNSAFGIYLTSAYSFSNGPLSTIGVVNADGTTASDVFGLYHSTNFEIGRHSNDKWGFGNLNTQAVIVTTVPGVAGYLTSSFTLTNNATYLIYSNWNGNLNPVKHRRNAVAGTDSANSGSTLRTGSTAMVYKKGFISEMIIYQSDQASNVVGMETNINTYFNIYP